MKIGLFDPYVETLGGGERYIFTIASLLQNDHQVKLFWDDNSVVSEVRKRLNINLSNVELVKNIFSPSVGILERLQKSSAFDVIFYVNDGSVPSLFSGKVIPIVQFPINNSSMNTIFNRLKFHNTSTVLCYSQYIQGFLKKQFKKKITVLYPAVDKNPLLMPRENILLSVGRFTRGNNTKKQEFLIDFFRTHKAHFRGWRLVLIGSVLPEDQGYIAELKKQAGDDKHIDILENIPYISLLRFYARAKIYLHASGMGEDPKLHPENVEHFGISVVEAMSAGTVPIVYAAGGPMEIVQDGKNGFHFRSSSDLFQKIKSLKDDAWLWQKLSDAARLRADDFSPERFRSQLISLL